MRSSTMYFIPASLGRSVVVFAIVVLPGLPPSPSRTDPRRPGGSGGLPRLPDQRRRPGRSGQLPVRLVLLDGPAARVAESLAEDVVDRDDEPAKDGADQ